VDKLFALASLSAFIAVAFAATRWPGAPVRAAGWFFLGGTVLFSGSLYLLALTQARWPGAVAPVGGLLLLGGWLALAAGIAKGAP